MRKVDINQAKIQLSKLIQEALKGEDIIISKGKKPLVKLTPLARKPKRSIGNLEGQIQMSEDFDSELEDFQEYMK